MPQALKRSAGIRHIGRDDGTRNQPTLVILGLIQKALKTRPRFEIIRLQVEALQLDAAHVDPRGNRLGNIGEPCELILRLQPAVD